jgi:hypothetical protein
MAQMYERQATDEPTVLTAAIQRALIEELQTASRFQRFRLHAGTTDNTHAHALTSWSNGDNRGWMKVRIAIKTSLSRRLTALSSEGHHLRLSKGASRKRIHNRKHFDYHMGRYLPKHSGVAWFEDERQWVNLSS